MDERDRELAGEPQEVDLVDDEPETPSLPKVAVCVPSFDHVHTGFAFSLATMCSAQHARLTLINHRSSLIHKARDLLVVEALKTQPDYILFLDSDLKFPPWTLGRLLSLGKDVVGAAYIRRTPPHELLVKPLPGAAHQVVNGGVHEVASVPTGCLLVKADVFSRIGRPYFRSPSFGPNDLTPRHLEQYIDDAMRPITVGEDTDFCARVRNAGIKVWLDVDLTADVGHIGEHVFQVVTHTSEEAALAAPANEANAV
jgi:hypothetical protein